MLSLKQLVGRAATLLRTQPLLWTPPLAIALLSSLTIPTGAPALGIVVSSLITLAVTAGWYALIARAESDAKPQWDDFFVAIGRHFGGLVLGTLVFLLMVGLVAVPLLYLGAMWAGPEMLTRLQSELPPLVQQAQTDPEVLLKADPALVLALDRLLIAVSGAILWYGLVTLGLVFWKQALVLMNLKWWEAFRDSLSVLKEHFGLVLGLLTLQAAGYLLALVFSALPFPAGVVGWMALIWIHVWSTVALTVLYVHARPLPRTPDAAPASPTGLPS